MWFLRYRNRCACIDRPFPTDRQQRLGGLVQMDIEMAQAIPSRLAPRRDIRLHQSFPGRTLVSSSLALFLNTLPSSGSDGIMLMKFFASLSVICGGSGG